jgi:hypothetical protein
MPTTVTFEIDPKKTNVGATFLGNMDIRLLLPPPMRKLQ